MPTLAPPRSKIVPTGVERPWSSDEIIVSKTDLAGRITYANDVFLRVSQYTRAELLGAPHSIIRHPDMPRAVFALLWQGLEARREVFAYVKNLARSGDHYWVFAHVTPSLGRDGRPCGYHSNRRTVDRRALVAIEALYARLLQAESGHALKRDAIAASTALLDRLLADQGLTYDEYVWRV
ncbi:MAG TPA: PAS domain-containing protein [Gemmatimonadaceae bacterium]|nr:PAS domain-containing protein [Gemmatimonadaceae bacterium]